MPLTDHDKVQLYRWMVLTRAFDQKVCDLTVQRGVPELQHASIGQEAIGVGACYGLRPQDLVTPALRTRAAFLVKGIPSSTLMAAMFGKDTKEARGIQTSHHIGDLSKGVIAGSGAVGSSIPVAVGMALAAKLRGEDWAVLVFFGDGATARGDFHEGINLAAVLDIPVVFICENNQYGMSNPVKKATPLDSVAGRAAAYGIPGFLVDGNDVLAVHQAVQEAIERGRTESRPTLLDCRTYRWRGHSEKEKQETYRPLEEIEFWKAQCPIKRLRDHMLSTGAITQDKADQIEQEAKAEIDEAVRYADAQPDPDPKNLLTGLFALEA